MTSTMCMFCCHAYALEHAPPVPKSAQEYVPKALVAVPLLAPVFDVFWTPPPLRLARLVICFWGQFLGHLCLFCLLMRMSWMVSGLSCVLR